MTQNPCMDCPDRNAECHSICERYIEWVDIHQREKEEERKRIEFDQIMTELEVVRADRVYRRTKRGKK